MIAGKFRVERVLGEGGMGYVVAARHLQLGQMVALKFMKDEVCTPEYKSRFLREARNTVRLKSKHVSRVLDVGALDGTGAPYMVMEYLEGTDLSELLHKNGPIPGDVACEYIIQACEAIAEAHAHGIVHRDLKPANLFLTHGSSGESVVKVLDFGVSKVIELEMEEDTNPGGRPRVERYRPPNSVVTRATDLLGSPSYMAPEQIVSARDADARSDIWSLGVILFRLVSGKAPFTGSSLGDLIQAIMHGPIPSLRDVKPDLPPGLEDVCARCLVRDRRARLSDVGELARLLAPYAGPMAAPSLERIAILGSALPLSPTTTTGPSQVRAWSGAPSRSTATKDMTATTALIWGAVLVAAVACGLFVAVAVMANGSHRAGAPPDPTPLAPAPTMPTTPTVTTTTVTMDTSTLPPIAPSVPGAATDATTPPSPPLRPATATPAPWRPPPAPPHTTVRPKGTSSPSSGGIPSNREL